MSSVKKMLLVDPGQWQSGSTNDTFRQVVPDGLGASISTLDHTISNILNSNTGVDEYTKAQQYSQALQRYLNLSDTYRDRPLGKITMKDDTSVNESEIDDNIEVKALLRQTLPTTLRGKGDALLDHLKSLPGIKWDRKQQLIVDGKTILDSNIVDLVSDLVRDRKTIQGPKGWTELSEVLVRNNIPRALIPNTIRRESLSRVTPSKETPSKEDSRQKTLPVFNKLKKPYNRQPTVGEKSTHATAKTPKRLKDTSITNWTESR